MIRTLLILLALALAAPAAAQAPSAGGPSRLAADLDRALALDAVAQSLVGARRAAEARGVIARSPVAGPPAILGGGRTDLRGPDRAREFDLEAAAPVWLPGQRDAIRGTVATSVEEVNRRLAGRRLEVAALLREAWWDAELARRELGVARDRLATARDIARDIRRRTELGDLSGQEALLGEAEALAAQSELARAEAALAAARLAYATLTGGAEPPAGTPERPAAAAFHPAVRAAEAGLAAAQARRQLVLATPRDNPEVGVYGRHEAGLLAAESSSVGVRVRIPLATEQRNAPRRAEAEAEVTRAEAELATQRRLRAAEVAGAQAALAAAERFAGLARERARVAAQQSDGARRAFGGGEIGAFDLFRVRQLALEAQGARARAETDLGRARSRLNGALGAEP